MALLTLVGRPGASENRSGAVTPTTTGTVTVVGGEWQISAASTVKIPLTGEMLSEAGSLIVRWRPSSTGFYAADSAYKAVIHAQASANQLQIYRSNTATTFTARMDGLAAWLWTHGKTTDDQSEIMFSLEWDATGGDWFQGATDIGGAASALTPSIGPEIVLGGDVPITVAEVAVADGRLTTEERATLLGTSPWTVDLLDPPRGRFIVLPLTGTNASAPTIPIP